MADFDLAIVGSGFAGSLLAMAARRRGLKVILLERGRHPRFAIGESSTPLANLLLEELAQKYDLPRLLPLAKWGSWQAIYPDLACGLKRGFSFYHHQPGHSWQARADRSNELLVAASPNERIADTHWYRPQFDEFLVGEAQQLGAEYLDEVALEGVHWTGESATLSGARDGQSLAITARFVADASGPRGFLQRALHLPALPPQVPATSALYAHLRGVRPFDGAPTGDEKAPPYPINQAALHHVFEGGWIWVLPFNNGLTSVGVAATPALARELNLPAGAPAWERLMQKLPSVAAQFADAEPQTAWMHAPLLPFRSAHIAGRNWAQLPSTAGFVDPLLSTGFPLALLGIARLMPLLELPDGDERAAGLQTYARQTEREFDAVEGLIAALYANFGDFEVFVALSKLYFAAASYAETLRRLDRADEVASFLLCDDARFGPALRACCELARQRPTGAGRAHLLQRISEAIAPSDVAGLRRDDRNNWHPVDATDLHAARFKLGASQSEIERLLQRAGF